MHPLSVPPFLKRLPRHQSIAIFAGGMALALTIAAIGLVGNSPIDRLNEALLDADVRFFSSGLPARHVVVVDIDDASLSAIGQWPWPRYRIASLIHQISDQKPAAVALDIMFPEADRSSLNSVREAYKRDFGIDISIGGVPQGMLDNDGFLGQEIAHADVIASTYFYFDHVSPSVAPPRPGVGFDGASTLLSLPDAPGVMRNADAIASQTRVTGFVNTGPDSDGTLRRLPMLISHHGVIYPSLSLAAVMRALDVPSGKIRGGVRGPSVGVAGHEFPIDDSGSAMLRFEGGPSAYASIPAVDLLSGRSSPSDLRGKIVFIGSSAVGLNDYHHTATDSHFPGLKVQAAMAESLLEDRVVGTPTWARGASFVSCLLIGALLSAILIASTNVLAFVGTSALVGVVLVGAGAGLYTSARLFVPFGSPLIVTAVLFVGYFLVRSLMERQRALAWRRKLENARQVTIESMASVAETRDPETGAHIKRTQNYVRTIAEELRRSGMYLDVLTKEFVDLLFLSAPLHDIGKVGVPDHILLKPGRLTPEEMAIMTKHAEFGAKIIGSTSTHIEGDNFLAIAGEIAATHHEKWDGTGYPRGLAGREIPLSGRIMAVADIYDALISRRCYKEPFTHAHSTELMRSMRGTTFDPDVLDAFFRVEKDIVRIASDFKDEALVDPVHHGLQTDGQLLAYGLEHRPAEIP